MENYRTFLALPLEVDLKFMEDRDALRSLLGHERISWVKPKNYHLTLRFIGDTPAEQVAQISQVLRQAGDLPEVNALHFTGPGIFGPQKKPRVLYVGILENRAVAELKYRLDTLMENCGLDRPDEQFTPHLTLGRIRSLRDAGAFHGLIREYSEHFRMKAGVGRPALYRSQLSPSGPTYTVLQSLPV
jgi:2'-5' RNA ligase